MLEIIWIGLPWSLKHNDKGSYDSWLTVKIDGGDASV